MKILFHTIRAAELWNSFAVGGSGGKRGKSCEPPHPRGDGQSAADGSTWQGPRTPHLSELGFWDQQLEGGRRG